MPYDAEMASSLANNLATLLELDMGRAWAKGTDNEAYPGKTTALPKIWSTYPEIAEKLKADLLSWLKSVESSSQGNDYN